MSEIARKKLFVDKSRMWNLEEPAAGAASTMSTFSLEQLVSTYLIRIDKVIFITTKNNTGQFCTQG